MGAARVHVRAGSGGARDARNPKSGYYARYFRPPPPSRISLRERFQRVYWGYITDEKGISDTALRLYVRVCVCGFTYMLLCARTQGRVSANK